jgi:hypothetical protein
VAIFWKRSGACLELFRCATYTKSSVSSSWDTLYIYIYIYFFFLSAFFSVLQFFLVFLLRFYLHCLISTPPLIPFVSQGFEETPIRKYISCLSFDCVAEIVCVRACVVAPTSSRFGKGIVCVLCTRGGVRWAPQQVIKEHESHKFSKMITVLYMSSHTDCGTVMAFKKFCRHGFLHLYVCTACIPECLGVGSCPEVR